MAFASLQVEILDEYRVKVDAEASEESWVWFIMSPAKSELKTGTQIENNGMFGGVNAPSGSVGLFLISGGGSSIITFSYKLDQIGYYPGVPRPQSIQDWTTATQSDDYATADAIFSAATDITKLDFPKVQPLATPTGLTADQITSSSARVGWNAVTNASGYKVEYKPHESSTWIEG